MVKRRSKTGEVHQRSGQAERLVLEVGGWAAC
jgi:hypothetical protein